MRTRAVLLLVFLFALFISSDAAQAELIAYWTFSEGQGTQTADVTGNGNDGTFNGDVQWVPGYNGTGVHFDTAGERIVVGTIDPSAENNAMTLAAWINWEGQDHSIEHQGIFGKRLGWIPDDHPTTKWFWETTPSGDLVFRRGGGGLWWGNGILTPYANEWTHVALTWDNGDTVEYINGEEVETGNIDFRDTADDTPVTIGCTDSTNTETFVGIIDEARIYNHALSAQEIQIAMLPGAGPKSATAPIPEDGADHVPQDVVLSWTAGEYANTHNVYFGTSFEDVNNATGAPGQIGTTFDPEGLLEFGKTYYWRVDEVNAPPDSSVHSGNVWSFTVEQFAFQVTNITATASSSALDQGPEKTVDGSGLDASDQHSNVATDMWLSAFGAPQPTWIQYEFDQAYALYELLIWNSNQTIEPQLGVGIMDVNIEYSLDGDAWTILDDVTLNPGTGTPDYTVNTTIDMKSVVAQFVRLTPKNNFKSILEQYGISEVRFFYIPVTANDPAPAVGESDVPLDVILDWRAGRGAVKHDVYLSKNEAEVIDGTAILGTVDVTYIQAGTLEYGQIYYWKVNEVNDTADVPVREGEVWQFSTIENFIVDDFEGYSAENPIWETWLDGLGFGAPDTPEYNPGNGTGSAVGDDTQPSFTEETIVNSGRQSMPLFYNNNKAGYLNYSETQRTFDQAQDWTTGGVSQLSLWFRGHAASVGSFLEAPAGTFTMTGSGTDITGTADEFHYAYKMLNGAGSIVAKVESIQNTNNWAKAGVMIRETLDPESTHAMTFITPAEGVVLEYRTAAGTDNIGAAGQETGITAPHWVKIDRNISGTFTASQSTDGISWQTLGAPVNIQMSANIYIGLALTSHDATLTCEAVFSNVQTTGNVTGQWTNQDIGIASNDLEPLYIGLADSAGNRATIEHEDPAAAQIDTFTLWPINLADFADQGVNIASVKEIILGLGNPTAPVAGGSGTMYFDDIAVGNPVVRPPVSNLLTNGGFEDDVLDPWTGGGAVGSVMTVVDTLAGAEIPEDPIEGNYCLHVVVEEKGENTWDSQLKYLNLVFEAGKVYTLSAFIKSDDAMEVRLNPQLSQSPYTSYGAQTFTTTNEWKEYYITTPPMPDTVDPAGLDFHFNYGVGEFWIDNIRFYEGDYVPPDGSPSVETGNIVKHGGFEDGAATPLNTWDPLTWSLYGDASMEVVSEDPIEGDYCLSVTVPAATANVWDIGLKQPGHVLEEGKTYSFSTWFKSKSGPLEIRIVMERDGAPYDGYSQTFTITDEWAQYTFASDVVPVTINPATVTFQIGYAAGEFLIDNVELYAE